jgi:hypothetical protein
LKGFLLDTNHDDRMPVLREVVGNDVEFDSWC